MYQGSAGMSAVHAEAAAVASSSSSSSLAVAETANPLSPNRNASTNGTGSISGLDFPLQITQADLVGAVAGQSSAGHPRLFPQPSFVDETATAVVSTEDTTPAAVIDGKIHRFIDSVRKWLRQWVTEGSSPLHHRQLYSARMPRCVQDAYTAMAMYIIPSSSSSSSSSSSAVTRATTSRILDDRVTQLLQDQALAQATSIAADMGLFDHLSRVQALLTYQAIRLFDGDVRMRAQAEALIPTLFLWTRQLLDCAKESSARPGRFLADVLMGGSFGSRGGGGSVEENTAAVWRAWILIESVRRTWLIANYLQESYLYMKRGWGDCPGRITFTLRAGLWDASSAYTWSRACCDKRGALFLGTREMESRLLSEPGPEDIDEFNLLILELGYGVDRIERWLGDATRSGSGRNNERPASTPFVEAVG
ncbi:hypothetical protein AAE478_002016 [Parahypoxylon ruwenzoriense]